MTRLVLRGFEIHKTALNNAWQAELIQALRPILKIAPLFSPTTPKGKPMSVRMTSAGDLGWTSDAEGYRYADAHPKGTEWPDIPQRVLDVWRLVTQQDRLPDSCLINYYGEEAECVLPERFEMAKAKSLLSNYQVSESLVASHHQVLRPYETRILLIED